MANIKRTVWFARITKNDTKQTVVIAPELIPLKMHLEEWVKKNPDNTLKDQVQKIVDMLSGSLGESTDQAKVAVQKIYKQLTEGNLKSLNIALPPVVSEADITRGAWFRPIGRLEIWRRWLRSGLAWALEETDADKQKQSWTHWLYEKLPAKLRAKEKEGKDIVPSNYTFDPNMSSAQIAVPNKFWVEATVFAARWGSAVLIALGTALLLMAGALAASGTFAWVMYGITIFAMHFSEKSISARNRYNRVAAFIGMWWRGDYKDSVIPMNRYMQVTIAILGAALASALTLAALAQYKAAVVAFFGMPALAIAFLVINNVHAFLSLSDHFTQILGENETFASEAAVKSTLDTVATAFASPDNTVKHAVEAEWLQHAGITASTKYASTDMDRPSEDNHAVFALRFTATPVMARESALADNRGHLVPSTAENTNTLRIKING